MGQTVYVLMSLEGRGKVLEWRPVAVVTNPEFAEQWQQAGKPEEVDWVPLEVDDIADLHPGDRPPRFQPRKLSPGEERAEELNKQVEATIQRMQKVIDDQAELIKKLTKGKKGFKSPLLKETANGDNDTESDS